MSPRVLALAVLLVAGCSTELHVLNSAAPDAGGLDASDAMPSDANDAMPSDANVVVHDGRRLAAFEHTCFARSDGLYCWGANTSGQLGLGDTSERGTPERVPDLDDIREVCVGKDHSCALAADGTLRCWGLNLSGQLGIGARGSALQPVLVNGYFSRVSCGGNTTCAIDLSRHVWCWGDNFEAETGSDGPLALFEPTRVPVDQEFNNLSVGEGNVCAVDALGGMWCWGRNTQSQCGIDASAHPQLRAPTRVGTDQGFRLVSTAQQHTCARRSDYALWCWGEPSTGTGKLGATPSDEASFPTPVAASTGLSVYDVSTNWFHSCVLHGAGTIACFGRNAEGQLGVGDTDDRDSPVDIEDVWDDVAAGRFHTCARRGDDAFCWGKNDASQLGLGDDRRRDTPAQLRF